MAKVIQADRDAAVAYLNAIESESGVTVRSVSGNHPLLKAFAAHREASTAKLEADMAALVELLERASKAMSPHYVNWHDAASNALTRIQGEYRSGEVAGE